MIVTTTDMAQHHEVERRRLGTSGLLDQPEQPDNNQHNPADDPHGLVSGNG